MGFYSVVVVRLIYSLFHFSYTSYKNLYHFCPEFLWCNVPLGQLGPLLTNFEWEEVK